MSPVLSIDLGGTKILAALVEGARVIARAESATAREAGPEAWLDDIGRLVAPWAGRFGALGVTVTGLVSDGLWRAINPGTLGIPDGWPLAARLRERFGVEPVLLNDAQAAAWGEHRHGAGEGRDLVFLTVSTGIGGGLVLGGRLVTGRGGLAGHVGQMRLIDGADGPVEDAASGRWIAAEGAAAGFRDARAVAEAAAAGDGRAGAILDRSAGCVATICRNLQVAVGPDVILLGGGVGLASGYLARVEATLGDLAGPLRPVLGRAGLGPDAGVIGVAALAAERRQDLAQTGS